jgi:hypothetical protein
MPDAVKHAPGERMDELAVRSGMEYEELARAKPSRMRTAAARTTSESNALGVRPPA